MCLKHCTMDPKGATHPCTFLWLFMMILPVVNSQSVLPKAEKPYWCRPITKGLNDAWGGGFKPNSHLSQISLENACTQK